MKTARRALTPEEKQSAENLKNIYVSKKKILNISSQEQLAHQMGFKSQGSVNQYFNGRIPLNIKAGIEFAKHLRCLPSDINPAWAEYDGVVELDPSGLAQKVDKSSDEHKQAIEYLLSLEPDKAKAFTEFIEKFK